MRGGLLMHRTRAGWRSVTGARGGDMVHELGGDKGNELGGDAANKQGGST